MDNTPLPPGWEWHWQTKRAAVKVFGRREVAPGLSVLRSVRVTLIAHPDGVQAWRVQGIPKTRFASLEAAIAAAEVVYGI